MKKDKAEEEWKKLSEEVITGTIAWREEHPKATMREIEEEVDKRLSGMRARMIGDTAMKSGRAEWEAGEKEGECPKCGGEMMKKGKKKRKLKTREGQEIELEREYGVCLNCGHGIFPPR
jgi:YgiT-type zinc finger domain-containing protein